jgi:hypothetical protein
LNTWSLQVVVVQVVAVVVQVVIEPPLDFQLRQVLQ